MLVVGSMLVWLMKLVIIPVFLTVGAFFAREYLLTLFARVAMTARRVTLLCFVFLLCVVFTGAVDIGSIAAFVVVVSSILVASPIFVRDQVVSPSGEPSLNLIPVFLIIVVFICILSFTPEAAVLPGFPRTNGLLTTYAFLGLMASIFGGVLQYSSTISSKLKEFAPEPEANETEDNDLMRSDSGDQPDSTPDHEG